MRDTLHGHFYFYFNLLSPIQHDFQKKRYSSSCQLYISNHMFMHKGDELSILVVFVDLTSAFHKVCHHMPLAKLWVYRIDHYLLSWISSFLSSRSHGAMIPEVSSLPNPFVSDIIFGSILWPIHSRNLLMPFLKMFLMATISLTYR